VGNVTDDGTRLGLRSITTALGAVTVRRPAGDLAVDRAAKGVASGRERKSGACYTAVRCNSEHRTRLGFLASTARLGARAVSRPARDLAVNGAALGVANAFLSSRAFVTTMLGRNVNSVSARLDTLATGLGASGPGVPGVFAIDGARVGVAILLTCTTAAGNTTKLGVSDDRFLARLYTAAAKLRASRPGGPGRNLAINRTSEGVASGHKAVNATSGTTVARGVHHRFGLGLGTSTAGLGASVVPGPARQLAINRASKFVAGLVLKSLRTREATMGSGVDY
jgi:hypothetical protein